MRKRKTRNKVIRLDKRFWVIKSAIDEARKEYLRKQKNLCPITGNKISTGFLDHCHDSGKVRGVLPPDINSLEGRYRSLFKRFKIGEKYDISFPEFLINMGEYLSQDFSEELYHHKFMEDFRKLLDRKHDKGTLVKMLKEDFNIIADTSLTKKDLIQQYVQHWVLKLELSP